MSCTFFPNNFITSSFLILCMEQNSHVKHLFLITTLLYLFLINKQIKMKNLLFIIGIVCLTSSFTSSNSKTEFSNLQFDEVYKQGYVVIQGQFKEIDLYFTTINGYFVFSRWVLRDGFEYSAQTRDLPTRGVGGNKRSIPLNQQNQYAIQYNFTHYVDTYYGAAYFRSN